ncbi:MAG TPA: hypothetical protein VHT03_01665 [Rhizomicrobium sp.]|jgi:hypothetical protein|nr:hypothetical protein [Rhizomicrobium sp.]
MFTRRADRVFGLIVLILAALILHGCAHGPAVHCPPILPYSSLEQSVAAAELGKMPPDAEIPRMMEDYSALRAACRAGK